MRYPDTNPSVRAGGKIDGTGMLAAFVGKPYGFRGVVRTPAGDAAGDYTVTLFDEFAFDNAQASIIASLETYDAVHPFVPSVVWLSATTFRVRVTSNGAAADCIFYVTVNTLAAT